MPKLPRFLGVLPLFGLMLTLLWSPLARAATADILIVYDRTAAQWVAANGGQDVFAEELVNRFNLVLQNSGVDLSLRLVHTMTADYSHRDFGADLQALQAGSGALAAVHSARDTYGADLVAMMVDTGSDQGTVGLGYVLSDWSGLPDFAFTVNAIRAAAVDHTMTHELGHNFGADHAKTQSSAPGPNEYLNRPYAAGWYFTGADRIDYHTIMAYNFDGYGGYYDPAPLFSTPRVLHKGVPAGHAQDGDNARLIDETKDIVAAYRASVTPEPEPEPTPERDDPWRVSEIYIATMGYAPDSEGLDYWVDEIAAKPLTWNPTTVAQSFFDQPLVQALYPEGQDYGAFIDALYQNIFGRAPDTLGYRYWLAELQSGSVQRNQMIIALIEGGWDNPEATLDMQRFGNRVEVALAFADYQQRNDIRYSDLSTTEQARLRAAGSTVLDGVTADTATRDAAIAAIPTLLAEFL